MKILVTGANGYLGSGIVKQLLDNGQTVVATDISIDLIENRAERFVSNIFEVENPYDFYGKPDLLLHLAWRDGFVHNSPNHIGDLSKHVSFIESMIESGIKRVAVMGSMHEIGFIEGSIDENTPCRPESMYGIAKDALRNVTRLLAKKNNVTFQWLRGYYIVGNSQRGSSIFSKIAVAAAEGKTEFPFTMGQNQFDFLDYEEFCMQVAAVVEQNEVNGIINICSGKPEKLCDRVERFIKENNFKVKLQYGVFPDRSYDSKAVWGDNKKIRKILEKYKQNGSYH
jgi:dTDP-6-deoxy-L-talose 4-dehydrogenase (NAD+)